jgi:chitin disaccharide deacetylase
MEDRTVIVNADDFGLTPGVNAGVARAHEDGILSSASMMVRWPAAEAADEYAARTPNLGVGVHVDLGEWEYKDGGWVEVYHVVNTKDHPAVEAEIHAQLDAFTRLTGRRPTHIDSHQHVHQHDAGPVFVRVAAELGLPLRGHIPGVKHINFYGRTKQGAIMGKGLSLERMLEMIAELPPGITEIGVHPGLGGDTGSIYDAERQQEVEILCDPRVREVLVREGVALRTFGDIEPRPPHDQ